jgi:hypothetical protein
VLIANPIYDTAFKYLLEDEKVARELLSAILGEEIVSIEIKPQETTAESEDHGVNIFRLNFKAVVKTAAGERRKVLIELQKAKHLLDIMRFRRYLAESYREEDASALQDGKVALPIVTIYLLGFKLAKGYPAVFKMQHQVTDVLTGKVVTPRPREPFIELLNHESYTVQIPLLTDAAKTRLEGVLMVFNQEHRTENPQLLNYTGDLSDPLVKRMVDRLARAAVDPQVRREMDAEQEVDRTINRLLKEKDQNYQAVLQEKDAALQVKDAALHEKDVALHEKDVALHEKDVALQEKDEALKAHQQQIAALLKQVADLSGK